MCLSVCFRGFFVLFHGEGEGTDEQVEQGLAQPQFCRALLISRIPIIALVGVCYWKSLTLVPEGGHARIRIR